MVLSSDVNFTETRPSKFTFLVPVNFLITSRLPVEEKIIRKAAQSLPHKCRPSDYHRYGMPTGCRPCGNPMFRRVAVLFTIYIYIYIYTATLVCVLVLRNLAINWGFSL